jgi:hypothetical protein
MTLFGSHEAVKDTNRDWRRLATQENILIEERGSSTSAEKITFWETW